MTTTTAEQQWDAAYSAGVRDFNTRTPVPDVDDQPCPTCTATAGKPCAVRRPARVLGRASNARCAARVAAWATAIDARRIAAHQAGQHAADETAEQEPTASSSLSRIDPLAGERRPG